MMGPPSAPPTANSDSDLSLISSNLSPNIVITSHHIHSHLLDHYR